MKIMLILLPFLVVMGCCDCPESTTENLTSLQPGETGMPEPTIFSELPAFNSDSALQVIIEIPAGTNKKREYDYAANDFPIDQKNGKDRIIAFVPYPGNYGFIPSTMMDTARGGDGDALDVLVLSEALPTGTIQLVTPVGIMELMDNGEIDNKILAVPYNAADRILPITDLKELQIAYPAVLDQLEHWFTNYKGAGEMEFIGWKDAKAAMADIRKWELKP